MAKAGYLVVMPDLFSGDPVPSDALEKGFDFPPWLGKHLPDITDPLIEKTIKAMRGELGVKKIGAVGYCFGGRYSVRFLRKGGGVDAGFAAHPTLVQSEEIESAEAPLSFAFAGELTISLRMDGWILLLIFGTAEMDQVMPPEKRHETEAILQKKGISYETHLYGGNVHGFAVRCDLKDPKQKFAKESAYLQAIRWFDQWLKN